MLADGCKRLGEGDAGKGGAVIEGAVSDTDDTGGKEKRLNGTAVLERGGADLGQRGWENRGGEGGAAVESVRADCPDVLKRDLSQ